MYLDNLISEIRDKYSLIFQWHIEHGQSTVARITESNRQWDRSDENVDAYRQALIMPLPQSASIDEMHLVAKKVQSGILEWNYGAEIDGTRLGSLAGDIIRLHERANGEINSENERNAFASDYYIVSDREYFERARKAYVDALLDNDKNLGSRVAIIDTNWEFHKLGANKASLLFRDLDALNFEQITNEDDNLFQLAFDDKLAIISIEIK